MFRLALDQGAPSGFPFLPVNSGVKLVLPNIHFFPLAQAHTKSAARVLFDLGVCHFTWKFSRVHIHFDCAGSHTKWGGLLGHGKFPHRKNITRNILLSDKTLSVGGRGELLWHRTRRIALEIGGFARAFPQKVEVEDAKMRLTCETPLKKWRLKMWNGAFARDLLAMRSFFCGTSLLWDVVLSREISLL